MVSDKTCNFASAFENKRAFSSVGLEHLPYKQRVGGSNPSTPTNRFSNQKHGWFPEWPNGADCKSAASSFGGSNPSPPTSTRDCFAAVSFFYYLLLSSSLSSSFVLFFCPLLLSSSFVLFFYSFHFAPYILGVLGCPREALFLLFTLQQDFDTRSALLLVVKVVFVVFHTQSSICAT